MCDVWVVAVPRGRSSPDQHGHAHRWRVRCRSIPAPLVIGPEATGPKLQRRPLGLPTVDRACADPAEALEVLDANADAKDRTSIFACILRDALSADRSLSRSDASELPLWRLIPMLTVGDP